ncbi:site-specific integrase [Rhizosphaericola mali]|nr:site-specific integrase [Rhizosphaericola mali]
MAKLNPTLSILFWLNRQRSKNETFPIYARITLNGKRMELSTHLYLNPSQWDQKNQRVKGAGEQSRKINISLTQISGSLQGLYTKLSLLESPISLEILKNTYLGKKVNQKSLLEVFALHNQRFFAKVASGRNSDRTYKRYEITKEKVSTFLNEQYKLDDLPLSQIQFGLASDFEHYLCNVTKIGSNTAMKYIKITKQVLKFAVDQGWIPYNPIGGFKCNYENPQREILTMEEIERIYNKSLLPRLAQVRDVYIFCCFTGLAFTDVMQLTASNIITGMDGEKWIITDRQKTGTLEEVPLLPVALEILEKYSCNIVLQKKKQLLPLCSNQRFNGYLQEIADICGIDKHLTSHTARHTFATTVTLENDVPIETVSRMLGHKSIRTTQIYAKITRKKISNNMRTLKDKLKMGSEAH